MSAYYNENDPYAAQWLRNLILAGHIAPGEVDQRSIADVDARDLRGFVQCHFFAGIGVWSHALRLAGWPDDRPVWTGSCPCQPFSAAGRGAGFDDARHLWPAWFRLIRECGPAIVLGEQVASRDALHWLDLVHADMEGQAYAFGAIDICVAGVGGPHWRQRLWWVANATRASGNGEGANVCTDRRGELANGNSARIVADASGARPQARERGKLPGQKRHDEGRAAEQCGGASVDLADADGGHASTERLQRSGEHRQQPEDGAARGLADAERGKLPQSVGQAQIGDGERSACAIDGRRPGPVNGFWADADWLRCTDGKWRPVEPGTFPLVVGHPGRVGMLRAYGNAICPQVAETFIRAVAECCPAHG